MGILEKMRLDGKVSFVTGGARGIGKAIWDQVRRMAETENYRSHDPGKDRGGPFPYDRRAGTDTGSRKDRRGSPCPGQVANGHFQTDLDCEEICEYMNHYLPEDIEILRVCQVSERFHSRLGAREKWYRYRIGTGSHKNVFERKYLCPLHENYDMEAMKRQPGILPGPMILKVSGSNKKMKKSTVRTLYEIRLTRLPNELQIDYLGDVSSTIWCGSLTGTLIEVGRGEREPEEILDILKGRDRGLAGFTAPARGLTLVEVRY